MQSSRLVVGIDVGASKTVVSYQVTAVNNRPPRFLCLDGSPIIPSAIAYSQGGLSCCVGRQAQRQENCIYWLKHIFDDARVLQDSNDELIKELVKSTYEHLPPRQREDPCLLISDFLGKILGHLISALKDEPAVEGLPQDFVFATPSTWSRTAHVKMEQAVNSAGFTRLNGARVHFVSEAEAVAVYVVNGGGFNMGQLCQVGDGVMVVDCGSSTVDITTIHVDQQTPFDYQRLTAFASNACGAVQFQSLIYRALENSQVNRPVTRRSKLPAFVDWARHNFPCGPVKAPGREFPHCDMEEIYDTVAAKIIGHIRQEIDCANICVGRNVINRLILVGGLSCSPEISGRIRRRCRDEFNIVVHQPAEEYRVKGVCAGSTLCGIFGGSQLSFKFWKNYHLVQGPNQYFPIFRKGTRCNEDALLVPMRLTRTGDGKHTITVVKSDQQGPYIIVGTIDCNLSLVPGNWQLLDVVINCRVTVRSEEQHLPPERMLHLAVHGIVDEGTRLIGHTRILMQGEL
ncbi:hypothetical protein ASPBRDRAFT_203827 [Aspergillus brasiliensis CBS 101740]|uniref:Uncharacterized protein n=1 Tax=Aspergillus brasiliensis (strain CBS 101740 / IMI 381727 / IBT 21946) TaxID=767769 RepID=A0A1L9UWT6_ASPBC|nr:hypothetical protein ASPBRDRAFT_203827 [Aspergillus brasiliensis CBS 101740]